MLLLARFHTDLSATFHTFWQAKRPGAVACHGFTGVADDDELFLDRFARVEVVILAGETCRPAAM